MVNGNVPRNLLAAACACTLAGMAAGAQWNKKTAGDSWTWLEDYAFSYATYIVACEPNRECQVGTGIFVFSEPRGEKIKFTGQREVTTLGFGAIHVRAADGKGPVRAASLLKDAKAISVTLEW